MGNLENNIELQVTSLETLKKIAKGEIVKLPGFYGDEPFVVRMVRPSMLDLISAGEIPNPLLNTASKLFMKGTRSINENSLSDMQGFTELLEVLCEKSIVEPSYKDIKDAGVRLTDEQKGAVLAYIQHGVKKLDNFREQSNDSKTANDVKQVQVKTE